MDYSLQHSYTIRTAAQAMLRQLRPDIDQDAVVVEAVLILELRPVDPEASPSVATFTSTSPWTTIGMVTASQSQMLARMSPDGPR